MAAKGNGPVPLAPMSQFGYAELIFTGVGDRIAMSTATAHYHIVIVGTDLGGLVLGALCAKHGYRVAVLAQGGAPTTYQLRGQPMVRRVPLHYGLQSPPVRQVFERLSLGLELRNLPRRLEPGFQVVLPSGRVDVPTDASALQSEFDREFMGDGDRIQSFFHRVAEIDQQVEQVLDLGVRLPPQGLVESYRFRRLVRQYPFLDDAWAIEDPLDKFPRGHPFRAFIHALFRFCSGMVPARPYPASFVRVINELRRGVYGFDSGPDTLRNLFLDIIMNAGDVHHRAWVSQVEVRRNRATHLLLRDRRQVIGCDVLICNTEPKRFFDLIPLEQQRQQYHHDIHMLQPIYYTFTGNFVVHARAIPEGMSRHVFIVSDPEQALDEDNLLHLARDAASGPSTPTTQARTLSASMRVPTSAVAQGATGARQLLDQLQSKVETVVPFLNDHLINRHCPWVSEPIHGHHATNSLDPTALQPAYGEAIDHTLGSSPLSPTTGYNNLMVASDAAFCGFGNDGPYMAALQLFDQVRELVPMKQRLG
jgi:phytoene dehydrogenase-like protein